MRKVVSNRMQPWRRTACLLALAAVACATLPREGARNELADAERAFAADCAARGIDASFIAHFAPDGLVFEPQPTRVLEVWPTRAPRSGPAPSLTWRPELVEVSRAGDLGYSTGPFEVVDAARTRPVAHGAFFSVWQRQSDGRWKVWLDLGGRTGAAVDASSWSRRPRVRDAAQPVEHATATEVTELDHDLSNADAAAFAGRLAIDARQYRPDEPPAIGDAWTTRRAAEAARYDYAPSEARVAASGDLAASYGRLVQRERGGAQHAGHYVHVWLRDNGAWWLAVESLVLEPG